MTGTLSYTMPDALYEGRAHAVMVGVWLLASLLAAVHSIAAPDRWMPTTRVLSYYLTFWWTVSAGLMLNMDRWPEWAMLFLTTAFALVMGHHYELSHRVVGPFLDKYLDDRTKDAAG